MSTFNTSGCGAHCGRRAWQPTRLRSSRQMPPITNSFWTSLTQSARTPILTGRRPYAGRHRILIRRTRQLSRPLSPVGPSRRRSVRIADLLLLPSRFGYYIGLRVAAQATKTRSLSELDRLDDQAARPVVVHALAELMQASHIPCRLPATRGRITHLSPRSP